MKLKWLWSIGHVNVVLKTKFDETPGRGDQLNAGNMGLGALGRPIYASERLSRDRSTWYT